jgi:alkylhydroperoxidase family enzyme
MGGTEEQLDAIARADYESFEESWRAAFRYCDMMTPTPGKVSDAIYAEVAAHWSPAQIVEITSVIAIFAFFNRFANALDIPITR